MSEDSSPISAADSNLIGAFALTHKHPDYTETTESNTESFPSIKDPNSARNITDMRPYWSYSQDLSLITIRAVQDICEQLKSFLTYLHVQSKT
jgi:hypothetical protein